MTVLGLILPNSPMCGNNGIISLGGPCPQCGVAEGEVRHRSVPVAVYATPAPQPDFRTFQELSPEDLEDLLAEALKSADETAQIDVDVWAK